MTSLGTLALLAAHRLPVLDPKFIESLTFFSIPAVIYVPVLLIVASFVAGYFLESSLRLKDYGWRFGLILSAWLAAIALILLGEFKLGVDLRGGVNLVYEVDEKATRDLHPDKRPGDYDIDGLVQVLRRRLNPSGIKELVIRRYGAKQIEIVVPEVDEAEIEELKKLVVAGGALRFLIVADETNDQDLIEAARRQGATPRKALETLVHDENGELIGLWAKVAREEGESSPFRDETVWEDVIRDHRTGEFIELTADERAICRQQPRLLSELLAERGIKDIDVLLVYNKEYDVRGEDLRYAMPGRNPEDFSPEIDFTMKGLAIAKMGTLTGENLKRKLAIVFDNELISAPVIQSQITESGRITGRFTEKEVNFMVELLKSGSMPVVLYENPISENLIGSILGEETIYRGSISAAISLVAVMLFTLAYYRFAGLVACLALMLNLLLTVAIMVALRAPFTLPGLAGLVLTVGMSVDSNVLIFERMREELAKGAALRMAIRNGFDRAFVTIFDSNLTTLLTAIVLYVIGTDQLKGFGVTLSLGIITSMFTAVFCARTVFDALERLRWLRSLAMNRFLTGLTVDWVKLFGPAAVASVVVIVIGLGATVLRGVGIFDIDLAGGTTVTVLLKEPIQENPDQKVREIVARQFSSLIDARTKGKVEYSVYQMRFRGEPPGSVFKIDSSLQDIGLLQKHVQEAFQKSGIASLRTYELVVKNLKTEAAAAPAKVEAAPSIGAPAGHEVPESNEGKSDRPAASNSGKANSETNSGPKEDSPCGQAVDEQAKDGGKPEAKEEPAKAERAKEPAEPSSATQPPAERASEPAADTPAPDSNQASAVTTFSIAFPGNRISAFALQDRLLAAAQAAIDKKPVIVVSHPQWDNRDNSTFEEWNVTMHVGNAEAQAVLAHLERTMAQSPVWQSSSVVSGQVTLDMQLKALTAILVSLVGIAAYVWFRFQNLSWGIAAIVSLLHDTLIMLTGIALSYWLASALGFLMIQEFKISLTVIAAFLTLIGFSINDTIVIFDRIREIRGKSPEMTGKMINDAVNQTMSRTILTTGTVLLVVTILYIWGGEGIHTFAFCMLIGCLSGTYSTVFIAAPLLLWLMGTKSVPPKAVKSALTPSPAPTAPATSR